MSSSPRERFLAFRRSLPRTPALHRQTVGVRGLRLAADAAVALSVPDPAIHDAHALAIYQSWFANRELAELFAPPRSDSLTGAAVAAQLRRNGYDRRAILSALSTPALVFHGTEDVPPSWVGKELAAVSPQARLTLIPDSGHMSFWEAPETFFPAVELFPLARTLGPAQPQ